MVHLNFADVEALGVEAEAPSPHVNDTGRLDIEPGDAALAVSGGGLGSRSLPFRPGNIRLGRNILGDVVAGEIPSSHVGCRYGHVVN
jgi:hypothetical protein